MSVHTYLYIHSLGLLASGRGEDEETLRSATRPQESYSPEQAAIM